MTQTIVYAIVFGKSTAFLLEGQVKLGHLVKQEDRAGFVGNIIQIVLGGFTALGAHVVVDGIDGCRLGHSGHQAFDHIFDTFGIGQFVSVNQIPEDHGVEVSLQEFVLHHAARLQNDFRITAFVDKSIE